MDEKDRRAYRLRKETFPARKRGSVSRQRIERPRSGEIFSQPLQRSVTSPQTSRLRNRWNQYPRRLSCAEMSIDLFAVEANATLTAAWSRSRWETILNLFFDRKRSCCLSRRTSSCSRWFNRPIEFNRSRRTLTFSRRVGSTDIPEDTWFQTSLGFFRRKTWFVRSNLRKNFSRNFSQGWQRWTGLNHSAELHNPCGQTSCSLNCPTKPRQLD